VEAVEFMDAVQDGFEGKLAAKIDLLHGCAAVYCNAAGASAIRQLLARGIQPLKVEPGTAIEDLLQGLRASLAGSPPAWLARRIAALAPAPADRFETMAAEGWQE
jgi:nitrogen fixation protein NifX